MEVEGEEKDKGRKKRGWRGERDVWERKQLDNAKISLVMGGNGGEKGRRVCWRDTPYVTTRKGGPLAARVVK